MIEVTPDLDSVNIIGKICDLQIIESVDACGSNIIVADFYLADETAYVKTRINGAAVEGKLKNGDILKIKNGRIDLVNQKIVLANDFWTKFSIVSEASLQDIKKTTNISEIQYNLRTKQIIDRSEEGN